MKTHISLSLLLLLITGTWSVLLGQQRFIDGTVTFLGNETRNLQIYFPDNRKTPGSITTRKPGERKEKEIFLPGQVLGFSAGNKVFISLDVTVDSTPLEQEKGGEVTDRLISRERVFLQLIVAGRASLYLFVEQNGREHFYVENSGSDITELLQSPGRRESAAGDDENGIRGVEQGTEFRSQLRELLYDGYEIFPVIGITSYKRDELTDLIINYNYYRGETSNYICRREKPEFHAGITAGVNITSIDFAGSVSTDVQKAVFNTDTKPSAGISGSLVFPSRFRSISIYNDLSFSGYEGYANYTLYTTQEDFRIVDIDISYNYLKLSNGISYTLPGRLVRPFIQAGISNSVRFSVTNEMVAEHHFYSTIYTYEGVALQEVRKIEQEVFIGAGSFIGKFRLEVRFGAGNGISGVDMLRSWSRTAGFSLGYLF